MRNGNRRAWQGDVCVRTLAARTRHPVARAILVFLITIAMSWPVGIAYGVVITELPDSELLWGVSYPETDYPQLKFYTNYGSNRYEALGEMLAGEGGSSAWPVLTADQRAYLSNPETGGDFYLLAQELHAFDDIDDVTDALEVPTPIYWWVVNVGLYTVQTGQWQNPEWLHNLWYMDTTQQNIDDAIQAVEDVLRGDVPGGGGGVTTGTQELVMHPVKGPYVNYQLTQSIKATSGTDVGKYFLCVKSVTLTNTKVFPTDINVSVASTFADSYINTYGADCDIFFNIYLDNRVKDLFEFRVYAIPKDTWTYVNSTDANGVTFPSQVKNSTSNSVTFWEKVYMVGTGDFTFDGVNLNITSYSSVLSNNSKTANANNGTYISCQQYFSIWGDQLGANNTPVVPPTNWPDPTPTPVPPTSPTVPVAPIINNTNNYTQNTYNTTNVDTSGDVTALLQKILQALDTHCVHLQNTIADELEINAKWITDTLDYDFGLLLQYLEDLADWVKANWDFDYSVAPYDDSSVLYWLRRIYNTLRTGGNTRPADPVTDPNGTGDWLQQLWQKFIDWMFGNAPLAVNELLSIFDVLRRKFPFCVPWDMALILGALVHEPVVPTFAMPCYAITLDGLQQVGTYTINLQSYDSAWSGVRTMLFVVFAFELAKRSRTLLDMLKIGGN